MPQMRALLLTLASGPLLAPSIASALGLGEISLHSALNQPLDARIELVDAEGLDANDFRVRLAGEADFARAGVERLYSLNDLRFTPVLSGGQRYIRVQSSQNMREPYLNFLIVVARPSGQLLREYTLLFDPPESSAYRQQAASLPSPARIDVPARSQIRVPRELPSAARGERYQVRRGDSLWLIARRLQQAGSAAPLQRLMEGILALNPQAFIGGDASRLKADASLLLPDEASPFGERVQSLTPSQPVGEVAVPPASSTPAPVVDQAGTAPTAPATVPPVASQSALEPVQPAVAELQRRLDDELQTNQQQNAQLQAQLQSLGQQLDSLQQALRERDEQIAALEARLSQSEAVPQSEPKAPPVVAAPVERSGGVWHWWLASSLLLGSLVVGGFFWRGRKRALQPAPLVPRSPEPLVKPVTVVSAPKVVSEQLAPATPARNSDPLAAANVYIAYGNFAEAAASLRRSLEEEPQRHELRLRLLEVLGQMGDQVGFQRELAVLQAVPECAPGLARIRELYAPSAKPVSSVPVAEAVAPLNEAKPLLEDDFKLNLEDLPLDADWDQLEPFQMVKPSRVEVLEPEVELQITSNLSELPEVSEVAQGELSEMPAAFERRSVARIEEPEGESMSPWDREPVSKTLSEFRSYEQEHDLSHLEGKREHLSQLNQALAYIEQGNLDEACNILNQLISDGSEEQKREAKALLSRIA